MLKFFAGINFPSVKSDEFLLTDEKSMPTKIITDTVFTDKVCDSPLNFRSLKKDLCIVIRNTRAITTMTAFLRIAKDNMMLFTAFETFNFQRTIS